MPARMSDRTSKLTGRRPARRTAAKGSATTTLPESMVTGKATYRAAQDVTEGGYVEPSEM